MGRATTSTCGTPDGAVCEAAAAAATHRKDAHDNLARSLCLHHLSCEQSEAHNEPYRRTNMQSRRTALGSNGALCT
eukprot:COSAG02_NODE_35961_length_460_cov_8.814404_1_plen_75_part_01